MFAPYQPATRCSGSASAGAQALVKFALDADLADSNMGIYSCREVRGGGARSLHSEGRAVDLGVRTLAKGHRLVQLLRPVARELGVQAVIFDRKIWSAKSPGRDGRYYGGVNPHRDHLHVELSRNGGANLTVATLRQVLELVAAVPSAPNKPVAVKAGSRVLRVGSSGKDVGYLQRFLDVNDDGTFGAGTRAAVRKYQTMRGIEADGVVGARTWAHILGQGT